MPPAPHVLGLDFGTSSVRAVVVRCEDGFEAGSGTYAYVRGDEGVIGDGADPHLARQHPQDYIDGLRSSVSGALKEAGISPDVVVGIGVDTTGSTPIPVDDRGRPLAFDSRFEQNPNAMAWLWKDHTSIAEASEITERARAGHRYMDMVGGAYSSEWFWSKILHCARVAPEVFEAAHSWIEQSDYIPAYLAGARNPAEVRRGICAAGHKALFNPDWGGLPSKEFLAAFDPRLASLRTRLYEHAATSDQEAGRLDEGVAQGLGLKPGIPVAVGAIDAHMGAVGSGVKPGTLVKIIGTSTCDIMVAPVPADGQLPFIPGMCGVVNGSVLPGLLGMEAGQAAVGDLFNWFVKHQCPPGAPAEIHKSLSAEAAHLAPGQSGLLALDWNNGNRSVLADQRLTGLLVGQTLGTTSAEIYRALIEATAFGALTIIRRMEEYGARVDEVVNCGGIAEKSPLVMQIYADVCGRPMKLSRSSQTCALGAAIFASVVAGVHPNVEAAQPCMTAVQGRVYQPHPAAVTTYARLYRLYSDLYDGFGRGVPRDMGGVMKELLEIRESALGA